MVLVLAPRNDVHLRANPCAEAVHEQEADFLPGVLLAGVAVSGLLPGDDVSDVLRTVWRR